MPVDRSEWDGNAAMSSCDDAACYRAICAGERSEGEPGERSHWALPHHKTPSSGPNANGVRNALARLSQTQGLKNAGAARTHLERHMSEISSGEEREAVPHQGDVHAPIETRAATLTNVNQSQRVIEVLAVPYGQEAIIQYRGELWHESFERGAFDGVERRPKENRVPALRDHNDTRLVGKVEAFWPDRDEGLVGEIRIGRTVLGDETLALAEDDMLAVSAGFAVRPSDQVLDRATQRRRIERAFMDHVAFVGKGAYTGAGVLAVRSPDELTNAADLPRFDTPRIDEVVAWMESRRR